MEETCYGRRILPWKFVLLFLWWGGVAGGGAGRLWLAWLYVKGIPISSPEIWFAMCMEMKTCSIRPFSKQVHMNKSWICIYIYIFIIMNIEQGGVFSNWLWTSLIRLLYLSVVSPGTPLQQICRNPKETRCAESFLYGMAFLCVLPKCGEMDSRWFLWNWEIIWLIYNPDHPCMVYLPTFGWFWW